MERLAIEHLQLKERDEALERHGGTLTAKPKRCARNGGDSFATEERAARPEPPPRTMIAMPATTRRLYVTGHTVMALRHPSIGLGFNWRVDLWGAPGAVAHRCDDPVLATGAEMTAKAIGDAEITDLRPALGNARHPDAGRDAPVWGATHVRAVLELAWQKLDAIVRRGSTTTLCASYDIRTMAVCLSRRERARAAMLGRVLAELSDGMELDGWNEWIERLAACRPLTSDSTACR